MTEISVFRPGGVSYLRIAAPEPARSAAFYSAVFGWKVRPDADAFQDATGHVIGHFMADLPVAGEAGVVPYIYVQDIDETLARVTDAGGQVTTKPYPEGDLWVAMTRDPAGNAIGVWQGGPRSLLDKRASTAHSGHDDIPASRDRPPRPGERTLRSPDLVEIDTRKFAWKTMTGHGHGRR